MGQGRCAGSMRGDIGHRPPCPPGVSCSASALPLGPLEQPGLLGVVGPWGVGSLLPAGPTGGPGGPVPRGWVLVGLHRQPPGPLWAPPPCPPRGRRPGAGGAGRTGHATGTSVPSLGGCGRPPPCRPPGQRSAPRATPGLPASPHLCSTCLHIGGVSLAPWPPAPGRAAPTFGWRPLALGRRAGWPAEPCVAPARSLGRRIEGSCRRHGPQTLDGVALRDCLQRLLPVRGADSAVGLALHCRWWKACSQWYTVVRTASWSSRSAGCAAAGHTPGFAALALSFRQTWNRRVWCSPSRSALTIMRAQSATQMTASGPGRRSWSQTAMCASAGLNVQTTHCKFCCPRWASARVAAGRACVIRPAWESGTSVALMASPRHATCRCSSWSGLQTSAGGFAHPGSCLLLGALTVCSRTASRQGSAII